MRWASNAFEVQARICGILHMSPLARVRHYHWMRCAAKTCIEALAICPQPTTHIGLGWSSYRPGMWSRLSGKANSLGGRSVMRLTVYECTFTHFEFVVKGLVEDT